jgi:hypothetical protein
MQANSVNSSVRVRLDINLLKTSRTEFRIWFLLESRILQLNYCAKRREFCDALVLLVRDRELL